jgi:hypothetical protein
VLGLGLFECAGDDFHGDRVDDAVDVYGEDFGLRGGWEGEQEEEERD